MNDFKVYNTSCCLNEYYPSINSEYAVIPEAVVPVDAVFESATCFYNVIRDQMNLEFTFFNVILPSNTKHLEFNIPLPPVYLGSGNNVSVVSNITDENGHNFHPYKCLFNLDKTKIFVRFISSSNTKGTFSISMHITCKVIQQ